MNKVKEALVAINDHRLDIQQIKEETGKLGPETITTLPEDIRLMFLGKMAIHLLDLKVKFANMKAGYLRAYGEIYPDLEESLNADMEAYTQQFETIKKNLTKVAKKHPLVITMCEVKGLSPYRLALIMSYIKDISRFDTPSKLMVYAGVGEKYGLKVCKRNILKIRELEHKHNPGKETEFGYNTRLQKQMFNLSESLMKSTGYFYDFYKRVKARLIERAINNDETFIATEEMKKDNYTPGRRYMKNRKVQSIEAWAHSNANWRMARTILHLIYKEWRELKGLPVRNPYPIDYLGHNKLITLDEVIDWEDNQRLGG